MINLARKHPEKFALTGGKGRDPSGSDRAMSSE
jgi:hypothetical protein